MEPGTVIRRSPRAVFRKLENEAGGVVLHLDSAAYHGLNEVGALIWDLIDDQVTFADLLDRMRGSFDEVPDSLSEDVEDFLQGLEERELVVVEPLSGSSSDGRRP